MQVDLYESGTIAIVEAVSPELGNRVQRVRVQLPGTSQELLSKFREKKVDFAAHTATEDGGAVFLNLLGASLSEFMYVKLPVWRFVVVVESRCAAWLTLQYFMYVFAHGFCHIWAFKNRAYLLPLLQHLLSRPWSARCLAYGQQGA